MAHGTAGEQTSFAGPVVLVTSPHAGHAQSVEQLACLLEDVGVRVGQHVAIGDLYEHQPQGERWKAAGFSAAVAAGGDGTVGGVATHLAGSGLPLGILPMGTANDVARSLDIPMDLKAASLVIAAGAVRAVDAGQVVPALAKPGALAVHETAEPPQGQDAPSPGSGAYFLHAMTLGLSVEFARLATDVGRRGRLHGLTYPASAFEALAHYRPIHATLRFRVDDDDDEHVIACPVLTVLTVNTPIFGGPLRLRMPGIELHDQLLDFVVIEALDPARLRERLEDLREGMSRIFEHAPHQAEGQGNGTSAHPAEDGRSAAGSPPLTVATKAPSEREFSLGGVHRLRARSLIIETATPMDLTMDGEIRAHTPALVRVAPMPVPIFAPGS
jgi:diacylglycerol kinase family enzyme